jgi:zinc D-Ala-D-Ala dipeptidase
MTSPLADLSPDEPVSQLRRILIRDNGEPLVSFSELCPEIFWVPRHPVFQYERFRLARARVAEMLCDAAGFAPSGIRLAVVEGWRPPEIQRRMHEETRRRLGQEHPEWSPRHLQRIVNRFSAPMDPRVPPPHTTGGAVDVHLVDAAGDVLDFVSPYELLDPRGAPARPPGLSAEAARNRTLLREMMGRAGFTNYPAEWWHWSYGDQGWAYRGGHDHALYAAIEPQELAEPGARDFSFQPHGTPGW